MHAMSVKLRSRRGASITFALLLFLVCAVVSSVVIVASTTSAGRMGDTAKTDQRYYAVMSAAELLRREIDGKKVVVTPKPEGGCTVKCGDVTVEYVLEDGEETVSEDSPSPPTLLMYATKALLDLREEDRQKALDNPTYTPDYKKDLSTLNLTVTDSSYAALNCDVEERLEGGLLIYTISNALPTGDGGGKTKQYAMKLIFKSNLRESVARTTVEWKFHSMNKVYGFGAEGGTS